tara:strand:- start:2273 stop:2482 length:210 start_codon:yes stop_codon:yes gene_type:complete
MSQIDKDIIYGKSLLYNYDDKIVQEIKEINNPLTIMYYLEEQNSKSYPHITEMSNILKKSLEKNRGDDV